MEDWHFAIDHDVVPKPIYCYLVWLTLKNAKNLLCVKERNYRHFHCSPLGKIDIVYIKQSVFQATPWEWLPLKFWKRTHWPIERRRFRFHLKLFCKKISLWTSICSLFPKSLGSLLPPPPPGYCIVLIHGSVSDKRGERREDDKPTVIIRGEQLR